MYDVVHLYWFIPVSTLLRYLENCGFYEGLYFVTRHLRIVTEIKNEHSSLKMYRQNVWLMACNNEG